jgi:hypothetical protein
VRTQTKKMQAHLTRKGEKELVLLIVVTGEVEMGWLMFHKG